MAPAGVEFDHLPPSPWGSEPPEGWSESLGVPLFEVHEHLPSTNDRLRDLSRTGPPLYSTVVARAQSQGRGRSGKRWHSAPDAGLWISILLPAPPPGPVSGIGVLPLVVGVAAARAIEEVCRVAVGLKWPNDLFVGGRKAGGILCEQVRWGGVRESSEEPPRGGTLRGSAVVAGIGINLRRPQGELPDELVEGVSFLEEECGRAVGETELARVLIREVRARSEESPHLLEGALRSEWEAREYLRGRQVRVTERETVEGIVRGVTEDGALLLEIDGECVEVRSGTVRPLPMSGD